jgi:hypothetical protein
MILQGMTVSRCKIGRWQRFVPVAAQSCGEVLEATILLSLNPTSRRRGGA